MRPSTLISICLIGMLGLFLWSALFPAVGHGLGPSRKATAKNDVTQIVAGIKAYEAEYGHLPPIPTDGVFGGDLFTALVGSNQALNPRNIVFIEINPSKKTDESGMADGVFVDPWGGPYRLAVATGTNSAVVAGINNIVVHQKVTAWNDTSQHRDIEQPNDARAKRRYVTSWE